MNKNKRVVVFISVLFIVFMSINSVVAVELGDNLTSDGSVNVDFPQNESVIDENMFADSEDNLNTHEYFNNSSSNYNTINKNNILGASSIDDILRVGNTWYVSLNGHDRPEPQFGSFHHPFVTLEYALTRASNGDTIYIRGGTYNDYKWFSFNSNINIDINKAVNILAYNGEEVIMDGTNRYSIWSVSANNVNISGITFKNGISASGGSALYLKNSNSNINIQNCRFINNNVVYNPFYTPYYGGSILAKNNRGLLINNCEFIDNTVNTYGGAIDLYNCRDSAISNCIFTGNNASQSGGAIIFQQSTNINIDGCNFTNNHANKNGGAIYSKNSDVTINNSKFNNNKATDNGGAAYINSSNNSISNSLFNYNGAKFGSVIYNVQGLTITNSNLTNNKANSNNIKINVGVNSNEVTITTNFTGNDNLINAIYNIGSVELTNVSYYGFNNYMNTGNSPVTPVIGAANSQNGALVYQDNHEAGQYITIEIYDSSNNLIKTYTNKTGIMGILH